MRPHLLLLVIELWPDRQHTLLLSFSSLMRFCLVSLCRWTLIRLRIWNVFSHICASPINRSGCSWSLLHTQPVVTAAGVYLGLLFTLLMAKLTIFSKNFSESMISDGKVIGVNTGNAWFVHPMGGFSSSRDLLFLSPSSPSRNVMQSQVKCCTPPHDQQH